MDIIDRAYDLIHSIQDAEANDQRELSAELREELAAVNAILAAEGFAPLAAE